MVRKCVVCGRRLRTGTKYCYECKSGYGYALRRNIHIYNHDKAITKAFFLSFLPLLILVFGIYFILKIFGVSERDIFNYTGLPFFVGVFISLIIMTKLYKKFKEQLDNLSKED